MLSYFQANWARKLGFDTSVRLPMALFPLSIVAAEEMCVLMSATKNSDLNKKFDCATLFYSRLGDDTLHVYLIC
jgi:hypothetical protein